MLAIMGVTGWFFVRPQAGEVQPAARAAVQAFFSGDGRLPHDPEGMVRYFQVVVDVQNRRAVEVLSVNCFQHRVDAEGRLDCDHFHETARIGLEAIALSVAKPALPGLIAAEHRFAQRRLKHVSQWEPTETDRARLHSLVNARAGKVIL